MDLEGIMLSEISETEKDKYCMISLICIIQKQNKKKKKNLSSFIDTESRLVVARSGGRGEGLGKMGEGGQKVQTSSYTVNKSWGYNAYHSDYS